MRLIDADRLLWELGIGDEDAREENRGEIVTAEDIDRMPTVTPESPRWISVKDKLPEERQRVLVACEDEVVRINWVECGEFPRVVDRRGKLVRTTHWMPLPQPPEEVKD